MKVTSIRAISRNKTNHSWKQDTINKAKRAGWQLGKEVGGISQLVVPEGQEPILHKTFFGNKGKTLLSKMGLMGGTYSEISLFGESKPNYLLTVEHVIKHSSYSEIGSGQHDAPVIVPLNHNYTEPVKSKDYIRLKLIPEEGVFGINLFTKLVKPLVILNSIKGRKLTVDGNMIFFTQAAKKIGKDFYAIGCTAGGNSGSPLFNKENKVRGVLCANRVDKNNSEIRHIFISGLTHHTVEKSITVD